jgi:hypothetical protein
VSYLEPGQSFAASLAENEDGLAAISFTGDSCTVPNTEAGFSVPLRNFDYAGDGGDETLERAGEGYIEVFATAQFEAGSLGNCSDIEDRWLSGNVWTQDSSAELQAAGNDLLGQLLWVDVNAGLAREVDVIGLKDFYQGIFVDDFDPSSLRPNLADVSPAVSRIPLGDSVLVSSWSDHPVDAVSALFMQSDASGAFFNDAVLSAEASFYPFLPTKRFYTDAAITNTAIAPFSAITFSENDCDQATAVTARSRTGEVADLTTDGFCLNQSVNRLQDGLLPENGWLSLSFDGEQQVLTSDEGHQFNGIPLRGFIWQRFVNGDVGGVRANYATGHELKGRRDVSTD